MKLAHRFGIVGSALVLFAACHKAQPGTFNQATAKQVGSTMIGVVGSLGANGANGASAAGSLAGVGALAAALVIAGNSSSPSGTFAVEDVGQVGQADGTGAGCSCTGTTCTFTNCTQSGGGASWSINGTLSWTAGHLTCALTASGNYSGFSYSTTENCDITYTDTSINGTLESQGNYNLGGQTFDWNTSVVFNAVSWAKGQTCPAAGSLHVEADIHSGGKEYSGSGDVAFNGQCI